MKKWRNCTRECTDGVKMHKTNQSFQWKQTDNNNNKELIDKIKESITN